MQGFWFGRAGKHPANRRVSEVGEKSWRNPESTAATEGPPRFQRVNQSASIGTPLSPVDPFTRTVIMTDNAARLQAMQDAVTDAGNDVRALKADRKSVV